MEYVENAILASIEAGKTLLLWGGVAWLASKVLVGL